MQDRGIAKRVGREGLRDLPLVTIDGENARDFDDAVDLRLGVGEVLRAADVPLSADMFWYMSGWSTK